MLTTVCLRNPELDLERGSLGQRAAQRPAVGAPVRHGLAYIAAELAAEHKSVDEPVDKRAAERAAVRDPP